MTAHHPYGVVVSDLHIFTERSIADKHMEAILKAARTAPYLVLNGDIFDFKWTTLRCVDTTIAKAVDWLDALCKEHPQCQVHYVLGNHDALEPFVHRMKELDRHHRNLQVHPAWFRMGHNLFLHGDLALDPEARLRAERSLMASVDKKGKFLNLSYSLLTQAGGHCCVSLFHFKRQLASQITSYLKHHHLHAGITDVYFGHTHTPFRNYHYEGIAFHNTGSTIRRLNPNFLEFRLPLERD